MNNFDFDSLSYSPICSWQAGRTQLYFSGDLFMEGELFKIAAISISPKQPDLSIRILHAGETIVSKQMKRFPSSRFRAWRRPLPLRDWYLTGISFDTRKALGVGSYTVQVLSDEIENDSSQYDEKAVIGEHYIDVLSAEHYEDHWNNVFGDKWDEPVYCDSLEPKQAEELFTGLPLDELLMALPEDMRFDGRIMCEMIGPITTAIMASELGGGLPFHVRYAVNHEATQLPHINLTRVLWLLNAITPILISKTFFSPNVSVDTTVSEDACSLALGYYDYDEQREESDELLDEQFSLLRVITSKDNSFSFRSERGLFEVLMHADAR